MITTDQLLLAPQLTPEKDTIKENKDPSQKLSNHVEHNHRNRRDLNTVDEAISSLDTFGAPSAETNRPQTSATVATSSSLPSTSATTTSQMAESESASSNYLSYKPTVTLLSSSSSLSDGLATQGPIIVDSGNDALTSQREQHQFGNTNRLAQPPPSSSLQLNQNVNQTAGSEQEENSLVLLKLESTIQRYQQRLRLLEQFVKISTQKLYAVVKRVSDLEKCDCHIGCNWNNTRYSDGYTWQKDCDICTCNRGSVSCKHQVCEPSPCQELHHVRGQCCPVCYKTCKLNDITLKHGHKTIMSINNDTCKECICLDGRIKCHQVELIVSRAPMVVASNSTPQHQHPKHWQQNQSLLAPMNDLPNQNLLQQQHQHPHRHHVHNYLQSATHNSDTSDFDHQKHLICPPINCPIEDRFHLVNDCCTYCRNFDFCFHRGHQCHENAHCININNSFSCVCDNGFTGNGRYCHDIDECQDDSMNQCNKTTSICINTQGSYKCQCLPGYSDIASSSISSSSSSSSTGNISIASAGGHLYNYSNGKSTSHDQRNSDNNSNMLHLSAPTKHNHMVKQQESDLITSGNMDSTTTNDLAAVNIGGVCQDVNECATKELNNCDSNARCINKIGSFKCRCNRGYLGNGLECHKWITSADNVANYRHNHRKRKKKLMQNNHSLQSSSSHDRPKELASERDNTNYVNGIAVPETTDLDNSITVSTSSSRSSLTNNFRMPVLKPIDEDDDYDDTDDDENDNEEDDNDDDDEDNMTSEDQYEDGDDSYADKDQSNYISASTGLASSQQRKQQLQQQQQQKYRNEKVCRNEQGFESANCDKQEYGKDLNETLSGTQYLPLINSDNSESEVSSSLRPVISLTGSSYKFSPSNNHDIQASSTSLNTRTMFQQPRPEITTTQSTYTATNQQLDKLVIKDVDSVKDSNSNNKQLDQTQTNISDNDAQQLIAKSSAIKTNHVPADNLLINNNYDQHHETLSRVSNQPEAAKQSTVSNQASLVKQTSHSDINRRPQSSTIPRKGTIITSAGSSPNKYRPQSSATSGSSSYSSVSSLHRGFLNSKPPSLALIITVIQHHCLILLTTLFTIYNSFTTRLLLSTITS